ncbi:Rad1-domain-containing protein [Artomyces pyxidatus]|uniref:Rad1-domain-containing protein n=1 Tax=Artomyces pyxidatus TaxID=48021 RepID=A0ACB8ST56_9AGAM|nr:Rad1-domain-containing protein [Artomyces pyxidatus]
MPNEGTQEEQVPPVLASSVHDIRYFSNLLRGVNFAQRATMTINDNGLTVQVEESRTITATAYIFKDIFDEFAYHPHHPPRSLSREPSPSPTPPPPAPGEIETALEIPLTTLIDCLNIFGTAGLTTSGGGGGASKGKKWRRTGDDDRGAENRIEQFFAGGEKRTGMRLSYAGVGHPLTLLVAEDAAGPTARCEVTTYDAEPQLDLEFDKDLVALRIILKSSWMRDALSELDPSCDRLTFIANPPPDPAQPNNARASRTPARPIFRIQAVGTFGSTEMDYPNDKEVLESVECAGPVNFSYRFSHVSRTLKALQSSTKTSLRIDEDGLLSLQLMMPSPRPTGGVSQALIEFRCLPLDETV